jgi:hypothetical protein
MQIILPEACVSQHNCIETTQLFGFRECRPPLQQSIARWLHFKNIWLSTKRQLSAPLVRTVAVLKGDTVAPPYYFSLSAILPGNTFDCAQFNTAM